MEETIFPPSPSWFLPNIISTRKDGSVAYGSKNNVVILKLLENKQVEMSIFKDAHSLRVTSVAFCPSECIESVQNTVVSSSEDGFVKLWNLDTSVATIGHKCHSEQKSELAKVLSVDWSIANPHNIVSVADNNSIVLWNILSNTTIKFSFQKLGATVVSCCPFNEKTVAVGGKSGHIYIIQLIGNGDVIYRLRGHDNKIHSLSWCPIPYNVFKTNEIREEFLLASACQDREVYIWRIGTDGQCETKFQIPANALCKRDGQHHGKIGNNFSYSTLLWLEPYRIYSSSNFGELIYFDIKSFLSNKFSNGTKAKQKLSCIKLGHYFHTKGLFAIAGYLNKEELVLYTQENIESELLIPMHTKSIRILKKSETKTKEDSTWEVTMPNGSSLLWTAGQDRKLVACELKASTFEMIFNYHTMNGFVYCAVVSPHDPNKIAIGAGDGMVRLWNLTESSGDIQTFWQKIKDRVMSLDWHPTKDGILAYGTSEGRTGLLDTKSNKPPSVFKPSHPHSIYKLSWGPRFFSQSAKDSTANSEFHLYSVGGNTLSVYNPCQVNADPLNLSKIIPFSCKKQTDVCWKPDYSVMAVGNEDGSICLVESSEFNIICNLLAYKKLIQSICWHPNSTSIDSGLSSFDGYFTSGSADNDYEIRVFDFKRNEMKVELVATLKGHHGHIKSVSWSPHLSGRLVSTSADGSVQIWDVISQVPIFNYTLNQMPLFSIWSPIDPDFIFTGCKSDVLYIWKTSAQTKIHPLPNSKPKKHRREKNIQLSLSNEIISGETQNAGKLTSNETIIVSVAETKSTAKNSKESKMFSKIWRGDSNDELKNCYVLLKDEGEKNVKNYLLPLLCHENDFTESIKAEEESHRKANNWTEYCELALWNGNIKEVLNEKIASGQLNDFLVSLAPIISPRVWQEACLSYSKTLREKKFYRKAATYLVVCHKIYEAIHLLMDASLYLEALCIARSRLPVSDPVLTEVVQKYAEWLFKNGSLLKACECYIFLEDYLEVARILGKKSQVEYLRLAALAAKKCGHFDLECLEATSAVFKCVERDNVELARQISEDHPDLTHLSLLVFTYHTISQLEKGDLNLKDDIISYIRESFDTENVIFPNILPKLFHKYTLYKNLGQVFSIVTQELSFAACARGIEETITHLTKALCTCCRYIQNPTNNVHPLYKLCCWLSPEGFFSKTSYFNLKSSLFPSVRKSMRAFLSASIVRYLSDNKEVEDFQKFIDFLIQLKEESLDADSYKYFQNLIEVEICEKRLLKNRKRLNWKPLMNVKVDEVLLKDANGENSHLVDQDDKVEDEPHESDLSSLASDSLLREEEINIENSEIVQNVIMIESEDALNSDSCVENCSENDLEEKITKDLDLLRKLKTEVEYFEVHRISSPNPVPIYFTLKKLCEENENARLLLEYLDKKWQELNGL